MPSEPVALTTSEGWLTTFLGFPSTKTSTRRTFLDVISRVCRVWAPEGRGGAHDAGVVIPKGRPWR